MKPAALACVVLVLLMQCAVMARAQSIVTDGEVEALGFIGDGSQLSNVDADLFAGMGPGAFAAAEDLSALDARVGVLEAGGRVTLGRLEGCALPDPPFPQDCSDAAYSKLPEHPFEFALPALGGATASEVVVVASAFRFEVPGGVVQPTGPLQVSYEVLDSPLRVRLSVWDVVGNPYDVDDTANWRSNYLLLTFIAGE